MRSYHGTKNRVLQFLRKVCFMAVAALLSFSVISSLFAVQNYLTTTPRLALENIIIKGSQEEHIKSIRELSGLTPGQNLISLDLVEIQTRVEKHPWVDQALLTRKLPHTVEISITERSPMLILALDELYYVDSMGFPFTKLIPGGNYDYPILTGMERNDWEKRPDWAQRMAKEAVAILKAIIKTSVLELKEISELILNDDGYLLRTINNDLVVRIGFGDYIEKFKRLSKVQNAEMFMNPRHVDLRYGSQVVVTN